MSADFWMNLQLHWDLYYTQTAEGRVLDSIQPRNPSKKQDNDTQISA
jgi:plasmid maintenance system antidote protein VapI